MVACKNGCVLLFWTTFTGNTITINFSLVFSVLFFTTTQHYVQRHQMAYRAPCVGHDTRLVLFHARDLLYDYCEILKWIWNFRPVFVCSLLSGVVQLFDYVEGRGLWLVVDEMIFKSSRTRCQKAGFAQYVALNMKKLSNYYF